MKRPTLTHLITSVAAVGAVTAVTALTTPSQAIAQPSPTAQRPCVAFSAQGSGHTSTGNADVVSYTSTLVNEGNGWNGTTFTAPMDGIYYFSFSFLRDNFGTFAGYTSDDVFMDLLKTPVGGSHSSSSQLVARAWAGQCSVATPFPGGGEREAASASVAVELKKGDILCTGSASDGNHPRHLANIKFTGFLVCRL